MSESARYFKDLPCGAPIQTSAIKNPEQEAISVDSMALMIDIQFPILFPTPRFLRMYLNGFVF